MVVYEKSLENKEYEGMGTTLEICLIYNNKVYIGHIGDSRIYRIRKEFIRKLTQDHSYVQKLVKEGKITIGPFDIEVIYTKGHTNDSVTYYFKEEKIMFTGDFIFKNSILYYIIIV